MKERIQQISINGRVALGISCLEIYLECLHLDNNIIIKKLVDFFWQFTSSNLLNEWDDAVQNLTPNFVLNYSFLSGYDDTNPFSPEEMIELKALYKSFPKDLLKMIENVINIGQGNLFAATVGYSEETLNSTLKVIKLMQSNNLSIPNLGRFERSKFSEYDGWGNRVEKSFFN